MPSRLMFVLRTKFWTRNERLTALPWLIAWRAIVRKPCAKNVEKNAQTMPITVKMRDTSPGCWHCVLRCCAVQRV